MQDRYIQPSFDHDPCLNKPLKPETRYFLEAFKKSREFNDYNLHLSADLDHYSEPSKRCVLWSRALVDRLFNIGTVAEAEQLLEPWRIWHEVHKQIWSKYYNSPSGTDVHAEYKICKEQFDQTEIPDEIRVYQGDLSDKDIHDLADFNIFKLTDDIREAINLFELPKPVSSKTVFRVQRITGEAHWPIGGLNKESTTKPHVERIYVDDNPYFKLFPDEPDLQDYLLEDFGSDEDWTRWNSLQVGMHVRNAQLGNSEAFDPRLSEGGIVVGFDLDGAGELMFYQPGIKNIVVLVRDGDFLRYQNLRQIVLDTETTGISNYTDLPYERMSTALTAINFGERVTRLELSPDEANRFIVDKVNNIIEGNK